MGACDVDLAIVVPHMTSALMMIEEILDSKESEKGQDRCNPRCPICFPPEDARQNLIIIMDLELLWVHAYAGEVIPVDQLVQGQEA